MLQKVTFTNPVRLVSDFVITLETTNSIQLVVASNDWEFKDGQGNFYSSIKFSNGWTTSITVNSSQTFDADFYMEPAVTYDLSPQFDHGSQSCLGKWTTVRLCEYFYTYIKSAIFSRSD